MIQYYAMVEHWKENGPPVYMSVAGYLGLIKPSNKKPKSSGSQEGYGNLNDLVSMFADTGGMIQ